MSETTQIRRQNTLVLGSNILKTIFSGQGWRIAQRPADRIVRHMGINTPLAYEAELYATSLYDVLPKIAAPGSEHPLLHRAIAQIALESIETAMDEQAEAPECLKRRMLQILGEHEEAPREQLYLGDEQAMNAFLDAVHDFSNAAS